MHENRVIVAGSRSFNDYEFLRAKLDKLLGNLEDIEIVSGMAKGADTLGGWWAEEHGLPIKEFPADWQRLGRGAGHIRNTQMLEYCTHVVCFWDGRSRGAADMIRKTQSTDKPLRVVRYK